MQGRANQKKSDGDAATWLPSNKGFRCEYVARQIGVKHKYSLWVTQAEKEAMAKVLSSCPTQTVPDYTGVKDSTAEKTTESEQTEQTQTEQSAEQAQQTQQTTQAPAPEPAPAPAPAPQPAPQQDVYYQNCTAARAAGAAPIYQGQPRTTVHNWTATMTESPANKSNAASPPFRLVRRMTVRHRKSAGLFIRRFSYASASFRIFRSAVMRTAMVCAAAQYHRAAG